VTRLITRDELRAALEHGDIVVLEALPPDHYTREHLPGARNLPLDYIDALAPRLIADTNTSVVTYCSNRACANSKTAAARLVALGYTNVAAYEDGKQDWIEGGLPVETGADEMVAEFTRSTDWAPPGPSVPVEPPARSSPPSSDWCPHPTAGPVRPTRLSAPSAFGWRRPTDGPGGVGCAPASGRGSRTPTAPRGDRRLPRALARALFDPVAYLPARRPGHLRQSALRGPPRSARPTVRRPVWSRPVGRRHRAPVREPRSCVS
jgi:rhodanese-related sulfurtransferase